MEKHSPFVNMEALVTQLLDPHSRLNIDGLLDAVVAIYNDCNFPVLKRIRNIETFINHCGSLINQLDTFRINSNDFRMIKVIGKGAYGEVQLVRGTRDNKVYAMKLLDKNEMLRKSESAFFWEEREIMARAKEISNEWIVQLQYAFQDTKFLYMVMEFMPGGDIISLQQKIKFSEELAKFYTAELVLALDCIHSLGYIHRDVKPDNILITKDGHIKLADFGTSIKMKPDMTVQCVYLVGTPDYVCPEVLQSVSNMGTFGREVDWWSVGIFLYEMIFEDPPFYCDSVVDTYQKIMHHETELCFPDDVRISNETKNIIRGFLTDKSNRLGRNGTKDIKAHPFFNNPNWTFENIRHSQPPYVPDLRSDDDTSYFDEVQLPNQLPNQQVPKAFTGNHLPFIGFTYSNDRGPVKQLHSMISSSSSNGNQFSSVNEDSTVESLREDLASSYHLISELKKQLNDERLKANELKDLKIQSNKENSEELVKYQKKLSELNQINESERKKIESQTNRIELLEQMLGKKEECEERLRGTESELEESRGRIRVLQDTEIRSKQLRDELIVEIEKSNEKIKAIEDELSNSRLINQNQQQQQSEANNYVSELWKLRDDKTKLETGMRTLMNTKKLLEFRINELSNQIASEHYMINMFKTEIQSKNFELEEKDCRIRQLLQLEQNFGEMSRRLEEEILSRTSLENTIKVLQNDKITIETEYKQALKSFESESLSERELLVSEFSQRDAELSSKINQLQEEIRQLRKHSHGTLGMDTTNQGLSSAASTSSLASSHTNFNITTHSISKSFNDLENLSRDQLIQRCQREIQLKDAVIKKLEFIGKMKGIVDDTQQSKSKRKKVETKRINELVELKFEERKGEFKKREEKYLADIQYMQQQLYDEQMKNLEYQNEVSEYRKLLHKKAPSLHKRTRHNDCTPHLF